MHTSDKGNKGVRAIPGPWYEDRSPHGTGQVLLWRSALCDNQLRICDAGFRLLAIRVCAGWQHDGSSDVAMPRGLLAVRAARFLDVDSNRRSARCPVWH